MSCSQTGLIECETVQIIEPNDDLLVETSGSANDIQERGEVTLDQGQTQLVVTFQVPKLSAEYHFEYLYIDAMGTPGFNFPGGIQIIPTVRAREGFAVVLAGTPIADGYVLHWRVVVLKTSIIDQVDAPEDIRIQIPRQKSFTINFVNPRSSTAYGFTELTVENLTDPANTQTPIHIQVSSKSTAHFGVAVNPIPPNDHYFLRVRTP